MEIKRIQAYYQARGLQWAGAKDALWFFLSEVGELAEAYTEEYTDNLSDEEFELLESFKYMGIQADEIVSRVPGWIRNNDRLHKTNVEKEVADCNMMLSVFMYSLAGKSPDDALAEKMKEKLGKDI